MGSLKFYATVAGCLALATSVTTARAADLLSAPPPPPPVYEPVADVGGWYLRGDIGVGAYRGGKFSHPTDPSVFYGEDLGSAGFAGGGVGYQFNSWFRADVTGEYRFSTGVSATDKYELVSGGVRYAGMEKYRGNYSAGVFLVNGYFDLGNWYGFTPFVGAGIGYAENKMSGFETSTLVLSPFAGSSGGGTIRNRSYGNLAWALHAGVAYDVTPNFKVELAYRYMNLGEGRTGLVDCYGCGQPPALGFKMKDIESHDIKLGMRWALGGSAPAYEPAPLMRKY